MAPINAVLFDLDGTLLDTAPDLAFALNQVRKMHGLPELLLPAIKPLISYGSKALIKHLLDVTETDERFHTMRELLFTTYAKHCNDNTHFFPGIEKVLAYLEAHDIFWGIVTNRLTLHTDLLLSALKIKHLPKCIVCGDTLSTAKPNPAPILHACELLKLIPENCIYIGDAATDIMAGKAAGLRSLVALYGYIGSDEDPYEWNADGYLHEPIELIDWVRQMNKSTS